MPPSGFYKKHSQPISAFLRACVEDLVAENKGVRTPGQAIQRELSHIESDIASTKRSPVPTKVLELAKKFYEALSREKSMDFDELEERSEQLIISIEQEIESIKVSDTVQSLSS